MFTMNFTIATIFFLFASMASAHDGNLYSARSRFDQSSVRTELLVTDVTDDLDPPDEFLVNYEMKMISCSTEFSYWNKDDIPSHAGVIFRLCPTNYPGCSNILGMSCSSGYGDYLVGINEFVHTHLKQLVNNETDDDFFNSIQQLAECRQYKPHDFFIGPTCTAFGTGIRMALFSDAECMNLEESVKFEDLSRGGTSLPYSDGGLVPERCESCAMENQYRWTVATELCTDMYDLAYEKCESKMELSAYTKKHTQSDDMLCDMIDEARDQILLRSLMIGVVVPVLSVIVGVAILCCCVLYFVKKAQKVKTQEMLQRLTENPTTTENNDDRHHHEGKQPHDDNDNDLALRVIN